MPAGCFQRLGAIGLMCRMEEESSPVLDIWGITDDSRGFFLLRVPQWQVDAVRPEGRVARTADDFVKVCVRENREIEVSMGPGPDGKIHHVNLQGSVHGPVLGTWDSYDARPAAQDNVVLHVVRHGETLSLISRTYNVPLQSLIERNDLSDGDLLRPGQELLIRDAP